MAKRQATSRQGSLFEFFPKTQKLSTSSDFNIPVSTTSAEVTNRGEETVIPEANKELFHPNDIGKFLGSTLNDELKLKLLTSPWVPENSFKFPVSGKRNLRFQSQWLTRFPWLVYTKSDGGLCKYCVLFSKDSAGKGCNQSLKSLVREPFNKWKNALETFKNHESHSYHKDAMVVGSDFVKVKNNQDLDIRNIVSSVRRKQVEENRLKLASIVDTINLCGRQELSLRDTNDHGPVCVNDEEPVINDGNFRALVRMRLRCGDINLLKHTNNIALNATYMSPKIQNELIEICGEIIQKQIVTNVNDAGVFSILVDETADISGIEQVSICLRYTSKSDTRNCFICKEDFLCFVKADDTTGEGLANTISSTLQNLGINLKNMIGQGYDGAAAMKGSFKGVQTVVRKSFPQALYVHCSSHCLNLALCHSCNVQSVQNCMGTVKAVANFLKVSPKRTHELQTFIKSNFPESMTSMCETRWVENHNSLLKFKEIYKAIIQTLESLSQKSDIDTSSKASSFLRSLLASEFVVCLCFLANVFSATITLCKVLQSPLCDLKSAVDHVSNIVVHFENIRSTIDQEFSKTFVIAKTLLMDIGEEICIPRLTSIQRNRNNYSEKDPENYFKISLTIPLLDDLINQLKSRFNDHKEVLSTLSCLIPSLCSDEDDALDVVALHLYEDKVDLELLQSEYQLWKISWKRQPDQDRPSCAVEALSECNKELFPNIFILLNIMSALPVSTATPERTFSTLRRLKTYLRNSCGQDRLTGLALLSVHRGSDVPTEEVVTQFAMKKERRLDLLI